MIFGHTIFSIVNTSKLTIEFIEISKAILALEEIKRKREMPKVGTDYMNKIGPNKTLCITTT